MAQQLDDHGQARFRFANFAFYILVIASLIPLWAFKYLPTQDGALHLYNAIVLRDYNTPGGAPFREYLLPNAKIVPNWICPHILPVLTMMVSANVAEKLLMSLYLVLLPLSVRYALRAIRPRAGVLAIAALPFGPNYFYHMGFQDFCLSLVGFFFVAGYWFSRRKRFTARHAAVLAVLLLTLYLTHLVSLLMLLGLIGMTALFEFVGRPGALRRLAPIGLAMLPVAMLSLYFIFEPHAPLLFDPFAGGWKHRLPHACNWMESSGYSDRPAAVLVLLLFVGLTLWLAWRMERRGRSPLRRGLSGGIVMTFAGYVVIFLAAPDVAAGGSLLLVRLAAYPLFVALLWWAAIPTGPRTFRRTVAVITPLSTVATLWLLVSQSAQYADTNRVLAEYDQIPPLVPVGSTLLPIHYDDFQPHIPAIPGHPVRLLSKRIDPFRHAEARGLAERGIVDLADHWASTDHHSVIWKPGLNPMTPEHDGVDGFLVWSQHTGKPVDYVLVLDRGPDAQRTTQSDLIDSQLRTAYTLVYRTPSHFLTLYRKTK